MERLLSVAPAVFVSVTVSAAIRLRVCRTVLSSILVPTISARVSDGDAYLRLGLCPVPKTLPFSALFSLRRRPGFPAPQNHLVLGQDWLDGFPNRASLKA